MWGVGWVRVRVWGLVRGEQVPIKGCIYLTIYLSGWIPTSDTDCSNLSTQATGVVGAVSDTDCSNLSTQAMGVVGAVSDTGSVQNQFIGGRRILGLNHSHHRMQGLPPPPHPPSPLSTRMPAAIALHPPPAIPHLSHARDPT